MAKNIKHLTTKEIKALNKKGLITAINRARGSRKRKDLEGLKRDELRHLLYGLNAQVPKQKPTKPKSKTVKQKTTAQKARDEQQAEIKRLQNRVYYRMKNYPTMLTMEAHNLLNDMLARATTKDEKIKAYKTFLDNPYTNLQGKKAKESIESILDLFYTDEEKKNLKWRLSKDGKLHITELHKKEGRIVSTNKLLDTNIFWKAVNRLEELFPAVESKQIIKLVMRKFGKADFNKVIEQLQKIYESNAEEYKEELEEIEKGGAGASGRVE
jgi:hypothetical protein